MSTHARSTEHGSYFQALVPGKSCFLEFTNASVQSPAFEPGTTLLELFSTQDCWVLVKLVSDPSVASAPAAGVKTNAKRIRGGITAFVGIPPVFGTYCLEVVSDGNDGVLDITEGL